MNLDKTYRKSELALQIKWLILGIILCGLVGIIIGTAQVLFFEQTPSGRYATKEVCIEYDMACEEACSQADYDPQNSGISCNCCLQTKVIAIPLGKQIQETSWKYGILGAGLGVVVGLTIAEEKKKKLIQS